MVGRGPLRTPRKQMLFTWDTTNLCIVFRQWHVRGTASLIFSLLAIVAICAGYEALREATRRYEAWTDKQEETVGPSEFPLVCPPALPPSPPPIVPSSGPYIHIPFLLEVPRCRDVMAHSYHILHIVPG